LSTRGAFVFLKENDKKKKEKEEEKNSALLKAATRFRS
jgi:hypothetical protein